MGVPRLFPWLISTFPNCRKHFKEGDFFLEVDGLYLDANGLLHTAAQIVFNYGEGKRKVDPNISLTYEQKIKKVYSTFFQMIKTIVFIVKPKKTLYIAIDGPAPLAKQAQQRQRRFISALSSDNSKSDISWESTNITPGTIFMLELTKYMHHAIRKQLGMQKKSGGWEGSFEVIFSPPNVPGEGEHKIMDYMRSIPQEDAKNMSHCMFGPDGDLIMLTLAAHLPKMFLFRSDQYQPGFYDLLDMSIVRKSLSIILEQPKNKKVDDVINDFILLGFFVGNDFLPKLQMFMYLEDGLSLVLSIYKKISKTGILTKNEDIDFSECILKLIIKEMADKEPFYLEDQSKIILPDARFKDNTLLRNIKEDGLDFESFRRDYYSKSKIQNPGNIGNPSEEVFNMCIEYIKSTYWVFRYYVKEIPSWTHYYSRYYAPLMVDVYHVMLKLDQDILKKFIKGEPSLPFVQLLSIISPKNCFLLPKPFHCLMNSSDSPLVKQGYYPSSFQIDYEGKTKEHMGVALLPFIDVNLIKKAYKPIADKLKNTYVRNSLGKCEKFIFDLSYSATYISDYGTIKDTKIRKIFM